MTLALELTLNVPIVAVGLVVSLLVRTIVQPEQLRSPWIKASPPLM